MSRQLLQQSSIGIETFACNASLDAILDAIAEGIDIAAFTGKGTGAQPRGILNTIGIGAVSTSGTITWKHIVALETAVDDALAGSDGMAYVTTRPVRGLLKTTPHTVNTLGYIWDANGNMLNGYTAIASGRIPKMLGNGSQHGMLFSDFSQLLVGSGECWICWWTRIPAVKPVQSKL